MTGSVAVIGYACLDKSLAIREFRGFDATSIITRGVSERAPRIGGAAHIARAVAGSGAATRVISWIGHDLGGERWLQTVESTASDTSGVVIRGSRSPSATMIEVGTGETICLFDPGDVHPSSLSDEQLHVLHGSDWVVLTVAPGQLTDAVLDALPSTTRLAWAVKHDDDVYSADRITRLLGRADLVSYSRGERDYIFADATNSAVRPGALLVETLAADGVAWRISDDTERTGRVGVEPISDVDATGAGDTFVGTIVGLLAQAPPLTNLDDAAIDALVADASRAVGRLLRDRISAHRTHEATTKELG